MNCDDDYRRRADEALRMAEWAVCEENRAAWLRLEASLDPRLLTYAAHSLASFEREFARIGNGNGSYERS